MIDAGTKLYVSDGFTDFEDAEFVTVMAEYDTPDEVDGLYDCQFIIRCDGEKFRINGWQAELIELA